MLTLDLSVEFHNIVLCRVHTGVTGQENCKTKHKLNYSQYTDGTIQIVFENKNTTKTRDICSALALAWSVNTTVIYYIDNRG